MKAAQIKNYGSSEVVGINTNAPDPQVASSKIVVEIYAAGVNPIDWKIREGNLKQIIKQLPITLGMDFSGVVEQVATDVKDFKPGDEVYGQAGLFGGGSGSFAEKALTTLNTVAPKPAQLKHIEAASLPLVSVSAYQAIVEFIKPQRGQKILIHGGAGGIGTCAIQIAKYLDAYVATTASSDDFDYVKMLGADEVVDYRSQSFEGVLHDYDAVFDTVGGETYKRSFKVLKEGGLIVSMLEQPDVELTGQYRVKSVYESAQVNTQRLNKISSLVEQGVIKIHIDKGFPLEQTAEALAYLQNGHPRGKVVIEVKHP